eukprot:6136757-Amphidinium_carterae.1
MRMAFVAELVCVCKLACSLADSTCSRCGLVWLRAVPAHELARPFQQGAPTAPKLPIPQTMKVTVELSNSNH